MLTQDWKDWFVQCVEENKHAMYRVCLMMLRNPTDAQKGISGSQQFDDGRIELIAYPRLEKDEAIPEEMTLLMSLSNFTPDAAASIKSESVLYSLPVTRHVPQVKEVFMNQALPSTRVTLEKITLTLTPLALYYDLEFHFPSEDYEEIYRSRGKNMLDEEVLLLFFDESGQEIKEGFEYAMGGSVDGQGAFLQSGSLSLQDFPDRVFIEAYNSKDGSFSEAIEIIIPE